MNLAFDVGGNVGEVSDTLKKKFDKVILFEPNPELHDDLIEKYKNTNVIVDNRGVSELVGTKSLMVSSYHQISTLSDEWMTESRFSNDYSWEKKVEIQTIDLNTAILEYGVPKFIKIDVEGYEFDILNSFNVLLENTIICFEFVEEFKQKIFKTMNHIFELGYKQYSIIFSDKILYDSNLNWLGYDDLIEIVSEFDEVEKNKWGMIYFKK